LMYDQSALDAAWDLCKGWDVEKREALRIAASVDGVGARVGNTAMIDLARETVAISKSGLTNRACAGVGGLVPDETHFLNALEEVVDTGMSPACELLERYNGDWGGDLSKIYDEYSY
ncbi:MAG: glutamate--cysteine ligase, partial [Rhodobacteraceae bacterium]|nr:glutamate--cysteine ligase [Paracoccaceae bacterium]